MAGNLENILKQGECIPEEMLLNYISGQLSSSDSFLVEKHLLECEFCSDALEGLRLLTPEKAKAITADLNKSLAEKISGKKTQGRVIPMKTVYGIAAAITVFLLAGGIAWYLNTDTGTKMIAQQTPVKQPEMPESPVTEQPQIVSRSQKDIEASSPSPPPPNVMPERELAAAEEPSLSSHNEATVREPMATTEENKTPDENNVTEDAGTVTDNQSGVRFQGNQNVTPMDESKMVLKEIATTTSGSSTRQEAASKKKASGAYERQSDDQFSAPPIFENAKALYNQKRFSEAEPVLEELLNDSASANLEETKWLLANCYMRNHKNAKARKLLKEIANSASPYQREAFGLLQELN